MVAYIARRASQAFLVLLGVTVLSYGVLFLGGDPTYLYAGENWTTAQIAEFRHQMGWDRPWIVQYLDFIGRALRGDLGWSLRQREPAARLIVERVPATAVLAAAAIALATALGLPLGILAATHRGTIVDHLATFAALIGQSVPSFWLGIILLILLAVQTQWLPVSGYGTISHLVLPALTLAAFPLARITRLTRSSVLEVLGMPYVVTARSKGLREIMVVIRHVLRNALIPIITLLGLDFGALLGGAVVVESIFAWPGIGRLAVQAIAGRDIPLVLGVNLFFTTTFVVLNLCVDVLYGFLDPRIRYG